MTEQHPLTPQCERNAVAAALRAAANQLSSAKAMLQLFAIADELEAQ